MDIKEKILIQKSKKGDTFAFEELIKRHEQKIYNLLLGMTGNKITAEDFFQETFLTALNRE